MSTFDEGATTAANLFEALSAARRALSAAVAADGASHDPVVDAINTTITCIELAIVTVSSGTT